MNWRCRETGLPEPEFEQRGNQFVVTLWRDWLTEEVLAGLKLTDRQKVAVTLVKVKNRITSGEYRAQTGVEARTATRDLNELVKKGVFSRHGDKRGAYYTLREGIGHLSDISDTFQLTG
jgi:ATP-dependent DNA helicase RecG